jgi:predicted PurR-regulated permease PerM
MIGLLIDLIVGILISFILILICSYLIPTIASASILLTVQATSIGLSRLQQINQTYSNNPLMQIMISQAQNTMFEITNSQISTTTQTVNKLLYTCDLFHNLSSIKDFLEIFAIPLILLIIIIIYIYKYYKNDYL